MSREPNPLCSGTLTGVDAPAAKHKRTQECQNGYTTAQAKIECQEQIKQVMEYRLMGYTYRQSAEQTRRSNARNINWASSGRPEHIEPDVQPKWWRAR